jgi:hypothetical protein
VVHRDIKPSNIRVVWDGQLLQAKVLDFGVAKIFNSDTTDEGTVFGTVNYMAPEYLQSGRPDARSDLFAVGVILYEALVGQAPFDGPSPGTVIYRLLHETPPPLPPAACWEISHDVQSVLDRAIAKDPASRFQSAEELAAALRSAQDSGWRWEQDRPAAVLPVRRPAVRALTPPGPRRSLPPAQPAVVPLAAEAPVPAQAPAPRRPPAAPADEGASSRAEVRKDILETTRRQLLQAIEIDPDNARAHAMLLATHYQLGWMDAVMQTLRLARSRGIQAAELRAVPRCEQLLGEEEQACRLPLDLHSEFMQYLGG